VCEQALSTSSPRQARHQQRGVKERDMDDLRIELVEPAGDPAA
jgi:hypothetical protein